MLGIHLALKVFIHMLKGEHQSEAGDIQTRVTLAEQYLRELLDQGATATETIKGYTPLMLYAYFNVTDERFMKEVAKGETAILPTVRMANDEIPWERTVKGLEKSFH